MKMNTSKKKIEGVDALLEAVDIADILSDEEKLYELGKLINDFSVSFLTKAITFAEQSQYGTDCDYYKKALELHYKKGHESLVERLRRIFVGD